MQPGKTLLRRKRGVGLCLREVTAGSLEWNMEGNIGGGALNCDGMV